VDAKALPQPPKSPEDYRKKYLEEMKTRLQLQPEQSQKLNAILDQTRTLFKAEKERGKAAMKTIHDGQVEQVKSILSDTQQAEYRKFQEERDAKMKEMDKARR